MIIEPNYQREPMSNQPSDIVRDDTGNPREKLIRQSNIALGKMMTLYLEQQGHPIPLELQCDDGYEILWLEYQELQEI